MTPSGNSELMNMSSKKEYLAKMRWRYGRAQGRGYKSRLIEELMALCGYSRKHAIKVLNKSEITKYRDLHPEPVYLCTVIKELA